MSRFLSRKMIVFTLLLSSFVLLAGRPVSAMGEGSSPDGENYIVVLREPEVGGSAAERIEVIDEFVTANGGEVLFEYATALNGFAAELSDESVAALQADPRVAFVERDQAVYATDVQSPVPSWGLDRIDQVTSVQDGSYEYSADGTGVNAYIIDTGIYAAHPDFGGRVIQHVNFAGSEPSGLGDCDGHGTHVAGTVAGSAYGVAKNANLISIRVLNCQGSGTFSGVIAGIDWVTANHVKPAVANLSLGGGVSDSIDNAVANAAAEGVVVVAAAGNSNMDACQTSPARTPAILTVGATTSSDARASYSNYGSCVDIFAPGSGITSAIIPSYNKGNPSATFSGTSMAAPHVAGAAAIYLQSNPTATQSDVDSYLKSVALSDLLSGVNTGSPNLLLHIPVSNTPDPTPTATPTATATETPVETPTETPVETPTETPTETPVETPTETPVETPTETPVETPTETPVETPTETPVETPTETPTAIPTVPPTQTPAPTPVAPAKTIYVSSTTGGRVQSGRFADEDILAYDVANNVWSIYFDGSDMGFGGSRARDVDAFHVLDDGSILLSITGDTVIANVGQVDDSDILHFIPDSLGTNTSGTISLYLDASTVGLSAGGEDVDAIHQLANGDLLLSTKGNFNVSDLTGKDEDLFRLTRLAEGTVLRWSLYFDGSAVQLNSSSEDIFGGWVDEQSDELYLTTKRAFSIPNLTGTRSDIFGCSGYSGDATACTFETMWRGIEYGFGREVIDGISVGSGTETTRMYGIFANQFSMHAADEAEEIEEDETINDADDSEMELYLPTIR